MPYWRNDSTPHSADTPDAQSHDWMTFGDMTIHQNPPSDMTAPMISDNHPDTTPIPVQPPQTPPNVIHYVAPDGHVETWIAPTGFKLWCFIKPGVAGECGETNAPAGLLPLNPGQQVQYFRLLNGHVLAYDTASGYVAEEYVEDRSCVLGFDKQGTCVDPPPAQHDYIGLVALITLVAIVAFFFFGLIHDLWPLGRKK